MIYYYQIRAVYLFVYCLFILLSLLFSQAIGLNSYDRPKQLFVLISTHPAVSMCCVRWIGLLLGDPGRPILAFSLLDYYIICKVIYLYFIFITY